MSRKTDEKQLHGEGERGRGGEGGRIMAALHIVRTHCQNYRHFSAQTRASIEVSRNYALGHE